MSDPLETFIARVREDRQLILSGEEATRLGVVLPILARLDWDRDNMREVVPEFAVGSGRVDYCLKIADKNTVFVEAKRSSQDLDRHQEQLLDYAFRFGVETAVLTNGLVWWLYLPLLSGSWDQRKFFTIDLEQQEPAAAAQHFRDFLGRAGIADGSAVRRARALHESREKERLVQQAIPKAWFQLCRNPDELLLEILAEKVEGLCGHQPEQSALAEFLAKVPTESDKGQGPKPRETGRPIATAPVVSKRESAVEEGAYTYKRPLAFVFRGERHAVSSFKDILMGLSSILLTQHGPDFDKALSLRGRKREYFSRDFRSMTAPTEIDQSGIFVETNISANNIIARCNDLLAVLGYPQSDLQIETESR